MPTPRLYLPDGLAAGAELDLAPGQAHYLLDVMRCRAGSQVRLFNGRDGEWRAVVARAERRRCRLAVTGQTRPQQPEPGATLLFAPLKRARLEMLVEKATELGVAALVPVRTRRTIVDRVNGERLAAISIEAAEQCERLTLPELRPLQTLEQALAERSADHPLYVGDESGGGRPLLQALDSHRPAAFLIGPEGGFEPAERARLDGVPAVVRVDLGPRILRAETAALMVLGCWAARLAAGSNL